MAKKKKEADERPIPLPADREAGEFLLRVLKRARQSEPWGGPLADGDLGKIAHFEMIVSSHLGILLDN